MYSTKKNICLIGLNRRECVAVVRCLQHLGFVYMYFYKHAIPSGLKKPHAIYRSRMSHMFIAKDNTSTYDPDGVEQNRRFIFYNLAIPSRLKKSQAISRPRMGHMFIAKPTHPHTTPMGSNKTDDLFSLNVQSLQD